MLAFHGSIITLWRAIRFRLGKAAAYHRHILTIVGRCLPYLASMGTSDTHRKQIYLYSVLESSHGIKSVFRGCLSLQKMDSEFNLSLS